MDIVDALKTCGRFESMKGQLEESTQGVLEVSLAEPIGVRRSGEKAPVGMGNARTERLELLTHGSQLPQIPLRARIRCSKSRSAS